MISHIVLINATEKQNLAFCLRWNGRGIALARQLAFERLEYLGCGNCVRGVVAKGGR